MADTGAPWNIPFVEPTDIPRGYPQDSEDLALAVAAGLTAAGNAGIGSNVVQTVKTDVLSATNTTFEDIPGMAVTITPSSATSKVLVIVTLMGSSTDTGGGSALYGRLMRDATQIGVAASPGSRTPVNNFITFEGYGSSFGMLNSTSHFLDSPETTSATVYKVQAKTGAATYFLNRSITDTDLTVFPRGVSSITAIEVAA